MNATMQQEYIPKDGNFTISPALSFELMKKEQLKADLQAISLTKKNLQAQIKQANDLKQLNLLENLEKEYEKILTMKFICEKGYDKHFSKEKVEWFVKKTKACYIDTLQNFSRPIYKEGEKELFSVDTEEYKQSLKRYEAYNKIKNALEDKVFDEILIVNLDYPRYEKEEKFRKRQEFLEKDPIAFGVNNKIPNLVFFIADWVDENCDLTLKKIISQL